MDHNPQRLCCSGVYYSSAKGESQEEILNFARFMNFLAREGAGPSSIYQICIILQVLFFFESISLTVLGFYSIISEN